MKKDKPVIVLLVIIAGLLILNLFSGHISSLISPEAAATSTQKLVFRGNGIGMACSSDGQYVFAAGNGIIMRSSDHGKAGSWEAVID
jgi:hypothetical protein